MARPTAKGVEYFPLNVNFINDLKVRKLLLSCGAEAIAVLIYLLSTIYKDEGYYVEIHEDEIDLIALDVNVTPEFVLEVINKACEVRFFDVNLYNNFNILTSKGIQERYLKITERRKNSVVITQFNLINVYNNSINVNNNSINVDNNSVNVYKSTQSKVKKSKVKKSKENNNEISGCSGDFNIYLYMQQRGFVSISPIIAEQVQADIEMYSLEEVKQAIDIADNNGKHSYSYVKGILEKRRANGVDGGIKQDIKPSESKWSQYNFE